MNKVQIIKQKGYNFLWIDDYLWMWDIPVEQQAQKELSDQSYGDVLVAGYGLGILQRYLVKNPKVKSVTTVEQLPQVIKETKKAYGRLYGDIIIADFFKFKTDKMYDCVIGDVWEDIVPLGLKGYNRFKSKAAKLIKPKGKILAWGQEFFEALNKK